MAALAVTTVVATLAFASVPVRGAGGGEDSSERRKGQGWSAGAISELLQRRARSCAVTATPSSSGCACPSRCMDRRPASGVPRPDVRALSTPCPTLRARGRRPRIATAIPAGDLRSVVAITDDDVVLTARLSVAYGGRPRVPERGRRRGSIRPPDGRGRRPVPMTWSAAPTTSAIARSVRRGLRGKVELRADVHHPAGLPDGPYPIVVFLHGNHSSCFRERSDYRWPCRPAAGPIPNHEGYDYLASRLASYGYVVVSVSGNGVNVLGNRVADTGMRQRGELIEAHLDLWRRWSTAGGDPFGDRFVGQVDLSRVGTMGHSRGGEVIIGT